MRMKLTREQKVADRYLRLYDMIESRLDSSLVGLERAESAQSSITGSIEAMGFGGAKEDKMLKALARIEDAVSDIESLSRDLSASFLQIERFVSSIQRIDSQAGKVVRLTYINRRSAKEIAETNDFRCSKKTVYELLKRGLDVGFELLAKGESK